MALYSMFVSCTGVGDFSTQIRADTPRDALREFLRGTSLREFLAKQKDWPKKFSEKDIVLFIPMDGLINMYLCQFGRDGKYVSVKLALTVSRQEPINSVEPTRAPAGARGSP